jgi:hypothetical protein
MHFVQLHVCHSKWQLKCLPSDTNKQNHWLSADFTSNYHCCLLYRRNIHTEFFLRCRSNLYNLPMHVIINTRIMLPTKEGEENRLYLPFYLVFYILTFSFFYPYPKNIVFGFLGRNRNLLIITYKLRPFYSHWKSSFHLLYILAIKRTFRCGNLDLFYLT